MESKLGMRCCWAEELEKGLLMLKGNFFSQNHGQTVWIVVTSWTKPYKRLENLFFSRA